MNEMMIKPDNTEGLDGVQLRNALSDSLMSYKNSLRKVLILPPDFTRCHSGAGRITNIYYHMLKEFCKVDIMPALGTHEAMCDKEIEAFFGDIPKECFIVHNWRNDIKKVGEVPGEYVHAVSEGLMSDTIEVEVNSRLVSGEYDLILSIGQVVPHEVVGMANYSKNIFVGCGGSGMINKTHILGAIYGMERIMGRDNTPVRKVFDYAELNFVKNVPILYVLTVTTNSPEDGVRIHGLFIGRERKVFEEAVKLSQKKNMQFLDRPIRKAVVYLDPHEFKSTWLGNKSIYRTRMAIADGGELLVLAPGVRQFGEDQENDRLIRKYGYVGRENVLRLLKEKDELKANQSVAAHLIHGSSDGRFKVTYAAAHLTGQEVECAGYSYLSLDEALKMYDPQKLKDGFNLMENGEEIFFIGNPALGLWAEKNSFFKDGQ